MKSWPATALTVCLHHAGKTPNPDHRSTNVKWAKEYLQDLQFVQLLTQAEADTIRLRCGWAVQMRMRI